MSNDSEVYRNVQARVWSSLSQLIDDCEEFVNSLDTVISAWPKRGAKRPHEWEASTPKTRKINPDPFVSNSSPPSPIYSDIDAPDIVPLNDSATIHASREKPSVQEPSVEWL